MGKKTMIYADWIASGRLYKDIEKQIVETFWPIYRKHAYRNFRNGNIND